MKKKELTIQQWIGKVRRWLRKNECCYNGYAIKGFKAVIRNKCIVTRRCPKCEALAFIFKKNNYYAAICYKHGHCTIKESRSTTFTSFTT